MRKTKEQKGITLIALVITIIVMLILAGVSIATLTGDNGVLTQASKARKETRIKNAKERIELEVAGSSNLDGKLDKDLLNENLKNIEGIGGTPVAKLPAKVTLDGVTVKINANGSTTILQTDSTDVEEDHNWVRVGDNLTCKCESCVSRNKDGITFTIGQSVDYTDNGIGSSSLDGEKSGVAQGISDGVFNADNFGIDGEQTITKDDNTTWVVLGKDDKDGNGTNETLLITTEKPTEEILTTYGGNPYLYEVDKELNRMCKEIYGENARSINAYDVNSVFEYEPEGGTYYTALVR